MEMILSLLKIDPVMFGKIAMIMAIVMACLSGASAILDKVAEITPSDSDNKIAVTVGKIVGYVKMVVDFISANRPH